MSVAGGLLAASIPEFRLSLDVVTRDGEAIKAMGMAIVLNTPVGAS
jgi:NADPH-dependent glutamate synthase beta subunit-like oxidoreductase